MQTDTSLFHVGVDAASAIDADDKRLLERYARDKLKAKAKDKPAEVAQMCNCIGELLSKYGLYEKAIEEHTQEKELCTSLGDPIGEAVACRKIGECYCSMGQYTHALDWQKRHLTIARECQNSLEEQRALATIGRTHLCKAESRNLVESSTANTQAEKSFFMALECCEKVKTLVQPAEYLAMKCRVLLNIGLVYDNRADVNQSASFIGRAVAIAEKHQLDAELLMCLSSMTSFYHNHKKYSLAFTVCRQGIKLAQKLRDKIQECDLLTLMATMYVAIKKFVDAKHCLKKVHKLKLKGDEKIVSLFKTVNKMQEAHHEIESAEDAEESKRFELYEVYADCLVELSLYREAIDYYSKVLTRPLLSQEKKAAIYMSLAQTFSDDRQYGSAILYYKKELEVQSNLEQRCRTNLNIAELEELNGGKYSDLCKIYMAAYNLAKEAKHVGLMLRSLKSLIVVQKVFKQQEHLAVTEKTIETVRKKYGVDGGNGDGSGDGDSIEEEEEQDSEEQDGDSETAEGDLSLSDLTVSDDSSDGESDGENRAVCIRKKRSDIARRNEKGETPLHRACIEGNLKKVMTLIAKGHPLNLRDHCGWLPLHEAANHGYANIVQVLLEKGAWINDRGGEKCGGVTPLIDAASCGSLDVMSVLMRHGASLLAKDDDGKTALDALNRWYNSCSSDITASDTLKYHKVEKLLRDVRDKNSRGTKCNLPDKEQRPKTPVFNSTNGDPAPFLSIWLRGPTAASNRFKRLPDLADVLGEGWDEAAASGKESVKERLVRLKQKRMLGRTGKLTRLTRESPDKNNPDDNQGEASHTNNWDVGGVDVHTNPRKSETNLWTNATESYRQVMKSMRSSAQSRVEGEEEDMLNSGQSDVKGCDSEGKRKKSPYMEDGIDVVDDWLINDVGELPKSKRKKRSWDVDSMLFSNQLRTKSSKISSKLKRPRCTTTDGSDAFPSNAEDVSTCLFIDSGNILDDMYGLNSDVDDCALPPVVHTGEAADGKSNVTNAWDSDSDDDLLASCFTSDSGMDSCYGDATPSKYYNIAWLQQDNQVSSSSSSSSSLLGEPRPQTLSSHSKSLHSSINSQNRHTSSSSQTQSVSRGGQTSQAAEHSSKTSSTVPISIVKKVKFTVGVNIEGKKLLVPIYEDDENKTFAWLAQQAAERYFSSFFALPVLILKTPEGHIFAPSDPISSMLVPIPELHTDVQFWIKKSAAERYEKACEVFYEDCKSSIKSLLQNIGRKNSKLDLNDMCLGLRSLLPIFETLDEERNLTELKLSGNRLTDVGISVLTRLMSSLPNVRVLVLDSNDLTLEGLESLSSFVESGSGLKSLTDLSLNYNCLTDKAEAPIKAMLKTLRSLTTLNLTACWLTSNFFTPELIQVLSESSITTLTLSENKFSRATVQRVLKLVAPTLKHLDLSHSLSSDDLDPGLDGILQPCVDTLTLQSISLVGCHLTENDVATVNRLPALISSLRQLNISQNRNIDNVSLYRLLSVSTCAQSNLHTIVARGCGVRSSLGEDFLDALKTKLNSDVPLVKLVFSCRGLSTADSDLLSVFWMDKWKDKGKVKAAGMIVDLSVVSPSLTDNGFL